MFRLDVARDLKVGDGSGDFQDSGICAGGQAKAADKQLHHIAAFIIQLAMLLQESVVHLGVCEYPVIGETLFLEHPCLQDSLRHDLAGFTFPAADKFHCVNGMKP